MTTIRTWLARVAVRLAIIAAPKTQADELAEAARLIWRPKQ